MSNDVNHIGWHSASGSRREIGQTLGNQGRKAVHERLVQSEIWRQVIAEHHDPVLSRIAENVRQLYPGSFSELEGLADGLELPFRDVLAWNCRGDLLASVPDGCTTVQLPGNEITIAHNEDGLPFFRGSCFIADVHPSDGPGFWAFCYPGSIPGHTFAWNDARLVMAVNNLRLFGFQAETPRMVLCREVLGAKTIDEAVRKLEDSPNCGGFHMSLAKVGDPRLRSVEFGAGKASVRRITKASIHANHGLHHCHKDQLVTQSSNDRQATGSMLLKVQNPDSLKILRATTGPGHPIWRDAPDDPDNENTLATSVFSVSNDGLNWEIFNNRSGAPVYCR